MKTKISFFALILICFWVDLSSSAQGVGPTYEGAQGSGFPAIMPGSTFISFAPTASSGSGAATLLGRGVYNGVPFWWTAQGQGDRVVPEWGCFGKNVPALVGPWLRQNMTVTVQFSSPVSQLGFVVWNLDQPGNALSQPDIGQVKINGYPYKLSPNELGWNRNCANATGAGGYNTYADHNSTIENGNLRGFRRRLAEDDNVARRAVYTPVVLKTSGITRFEFTIINDSGDGAGFAGIISPPIIKSKTGGLREAAQADSTISEQAASWQANGTHLQNTNAGGVIIGSEITETPGEYNLFVSKGILTEKVKVALHGTEDWADKVFEKDYQLKSLTEVEQHIQQHGHLPGVPSAQEMVESGNDLQKTDAKLLEKIEELTLYLIEMKKENKLIREDNDRLNKKLNVLQSQVGNQSLDK